MILLLGVVFFIFTSFASAVDVLSRDPFCLPHFSTKAAQNQHFILQGIVRQENKYGAVLGYGKESTVVFVDDTCEGYVVIDVTQNEVCLMQGAKRLVLKLEQEV